MLIGSQQTFTYTMRWVTRKYFWCNWKNVKSICQLLSKVSAGILNNLPWWWCAFSNLLDACFFHKVNYVSFILLGGWCLQVNLVIIFLDNLPARKVWCDQYREVIWLSMIYVHTCTIYTPPHLTSYFKGIHNRFWEWNTLFHIFRH